MPYPYLPNPINIEEMTENIGFLGYMMECWEEENKEDDDDENGAFF